MRRVIFTMLLSIVSSSAAAAWEQWFVPKSNLSEWVVANYNEAVTIYADTATVRRAGNMAQMWDLTDFRTGKALSGDKRSLSFRKEQEYDCSGQRARILYISWHSENMEQVKYLAATVPLAIGDQSFGARYSKDCGQRPVENRR